MPGTRASRFHGVRRKLTSTALVFALVCVSFPHVFAVGSNEDRDTEREALRARKVAFHSGNEGTTFSEVSLVVLAAPLGVFIRRAMDVRKGVRVTFGGIVANDRGHPVDAVHVVAKDFVTCVVPVAGAMFRPEYVLPALVVCAVMSYLRAKQAVANRSLRAPTPTPNMYDAVPSPLGNVGRFGASRPYLTSYRACMTLATAVAILAVDFPAFPRRFGKTETHGVGLMDVGAGSFMFANALVSCRRGGRAAKDFFADIGAVRQARRLANRIAPLVLLALFRAWSTSSIDYHVPVGEYGKHWNFFATLASVLIAVDMLPVPPGTSTIFGASLLAVHQWLLSSKRMWSILAGAKYLVEFHKAVGSDDGNASPFAHSTMGEWLSHDERSAKFVSQNKEGIFSLPGYVGLYFLGVGLGVWMETSLATDAAKARKKMDDHVADLVQRAKRAREIALDAVRTAMDSERRAHAALKSRDADALEAKAATAQKRHRHRQAREHFDAEQLISRVTTAPGGRADPNETPEGGWRWAWAWLGKLTAVSLFFWCAALVFHVFVEPASRRSANGAYGLWMVAFNMQVIVAIIAGSLVFPGSLPAPKLLQAVNRNLLGVFLFSNIVTGTVNLVWRNALDTRDEVAYAVVTVYALSVCAFSIATGADEVAMENRRVGRKAD